MDVNLQMIAKVAAICNDANVEQSDNQFVTTLSWSFSLLLFNHFFIGVCFLEQVLVEKMRFPEGSTNASTLADGDVLHMYS